MTLAVAESVVQQKGLDGADLAARFVASYESELWRGYGTSTKLVLHALEAGQPWEQAGRALYDGVGSLGNDAAMRCAPIVLLAINDDSQRVASLASQVAMITRTHPFGVEEAILHTCALALLVQLPISTPVDTESVPTALSLFLRSPDSFWEVARSSIEFGGDTDTIMAMACALSRARLGENGIPARWQTQVEGNGRIIELADALAQVVLHQFKRKKGL